jgi:sulfur relay (sulfurtransferase) DsrC/TusE family protein
MKTEQLPIPLGKVDVWELQLVELRRTARTRIELGQDHWACLRIVREMMEDWNEKFKREHGITAS